MSSKLIRTRNGGLSIHTDPKPKIDHWHNVDCGMSWSGFNVSGDKGSIAEVRRLHHREGFLTQVETILRARLEVAEETEKKLLGALRAAWHELNTIRARDGVAYHRDPPYRGGTPYCAEEAWDDLTQRCAEAIEHCTGEPPKPWPFPWENEA